MESCVFFTLLNWKAQFFHGCLWLYVWLYRDLSSYLQKTSRHCQWCKLLDQSWLINTVKAILVPDTMEAMSMCFWNIWLLSLGNSWIGMMTVDTYIQVHWHGRKIVLVACIRSFWARSCRKGRYVYPCTFKMQFGFLLFRMVLCCGIFSKLFCFYIDSFMYVNC